MSIFLQNWMLEFPFFAILVAFAIGYLAMPFVLKMAIRKQLVVKPNRRTSHKGAVPNVGGINIFSSFFITYFLFSDPPLTNTIKLFFVGAYFIFIVGFFDDLLTFSAKKKLIGELIASFIIIVVADIKLNHFYGFLSISQVPDNLIVLSYFVSAFLYLLIINSLNLIDGVDGLATGLGMVICMFFGVYFQFVGQINLALMAYSLIGALAIFFFYNVFGNRSKIFMGDSGSLLLGSVIYLFVIKFCEINITQVNSPYYVYAAPAVAACVMAVPMFDTLRVMITRVKKGYSPFVADKNHVHHLLLAMGYSHRKVTLILVLVQMSFIALALVGHSWKNPILGGLAVVIAIGYTLLIWKLKDRHDRKVKEQLN